MIFIPLPTDLLCRGDWSEIFPAHDVMTTTECLDVMLQFIASIYCFN